jgi:16S rRNA (guanine966-N2)-methyltransferase
MRIIAGVLAGRHFESPRTHRTHPMSDKARGGLFNTLGDIDGLTILDAFAGSGALSFEAISRGSGHVTAVEIDKTAHRTIEENIAGLQLRRDRIKAIRANASGWSDNNPDKLFDIVFSAPPYDNLQEALVRKLVKHVKPDGLYVLDWPGKTAPPDLDGTELLKASDYGDAQLVFYRKIL